MSSSQSGVMTSDQYLQTDEQTLLEIAPHWRLMQVFPREPRRIGYDCGAGTRHMITSGWKAGVPVISTWREEWNE